MRAELILASGSPQRKRILLSLGISFKAIPSDAEETHDGLRRPHAIARHLALKKARAVSKRHPDAWVLGVDTLVVLPNGRIAGKPQNQTTARAMLKSYRGKHCDVYSGIALVHDRKNRSMTAWEVSRLYFKDYSDADIERYLRRGRWQRVSGGLTIEGAGEWIKRLKGDYWNVVGLPVKSLKKLLGLISPPKYCATP